MRNTLRLAGIHPLVRYVDQDHAVVDAHFITMQAQPPTPDLSNITVDVMLKISGSNGFVDEGQTRLRLSDGAGSLRFDIVHPQRWWPASMGAQPLYKLSLSLLGDQDEPDCQTITMGLTSVRRRLEHDFFTEPTLLVNGQIYDINSVVIVDRVDEHHLLPATGTSLILVRDHYGPNLLYDAADRAGILMVQCVPISPAGTPEIDVAAQIERLTSHPSLAGWFVGHLGKASDEVAQKIKDLDPARTVFRKFPACPAA
jgi:beta-galactosidase/beta-glucuronidase